MKAVGNMVAENGLPDFLSPFVIGVSGSGVVSKGAVELYKNCLPYE